jgi:orotate phosphoribosyltransferase-like protein
MTARPMSERVRELHARGLSKGEVLAKLGCSRQTYDAALKSSPVRGRPPVVATAIDWEGLDVDALAELARHGRTLDVRNTAIAHLAARAKS